MINLQGSSSNWFKNQFCHSVRLSRLYGHWARICKSLESPGIDSEELIGFFTKSKNKEMNWELPFINMSILKLLSEREVLLALSLKKSLPRESESFYLYSWILNDDSRLAVKKGNSASGQIPLVIISVCNFYRTRTFEIIQIFKLEMIYKLNADCRVPARLTRTWNEDKSRTRSWNCFNLHNQSPISTITTTSLFTLLYTYPSLCLKGTRKCFANISQQWGGVCA